MYASICVLSNAILSLAKLFEKHFYFCHLGLLVLHTLDMCPNGICMFGPAGSVSVYMCARVCMHSPNDDIFASCRVAFEFIPGGLVVPTITVYGFLLDRYPPETSSRKIGAESHFSCTYIVQKLHSSAMTGDKLTLQHQFSEMWFDSHDTNSAFLILDLQRTLLL